MFSEFLYWGFQSVEIDEDKDILKIEDRRIAKHFWIILIVFGAAFITAYPLYLYLSASWSGFAIALFISVIVLIIFAIGAYKISQIPYRRIYSFNKKQGTFRLIEISPFKTDENGGKLKDVKRVQINVYRKENDENSSVSYTYQTFLILDSFLAYDDSNMIAVEEESGNESTSNRIAAAISDFLQVPFNIEEHF